MKWFPAHTVLPTMVLAAVFPFASGAADASAQVAPVTLSKPATPTSMPTAEGFIQRWLVLEPIPSNGLTQNIVQADVKKDSLPDTSLPHDGQKVIINGKELTWHAEDTKNYNLNLFHFATGLGKPTSDVLFWVITVVNSPAEVHDVRLAIGSNAASIWWFNDEEVIGIYGDRQTTIDDGVSKRLTLKKGRNVIRAAVINGGGATDFCARLLDGNDKPIRNITITLNK